MNTERPWTWKVAREVSSGGVVYRPAGRGGVRVVVTARAGAPVWCLPKGHAEKGETLREAAVREAREETGLATEAGRKVATIRYWFADAKRGRRVWKTVHFYLLKHQGGRTGDHDHEVSAVRWLAPEQALKRLSYPGERVALRAALRVLGA